MHARPTDSRGCQSTSSLNFYQWACTVSPPLIWTMDHRSPLRTCRQDAQSHTGWNSCSIIPPYVMWTAGGSVITHSKHHRDKKNSLYISYITLLESRTVRFFFFKHDWWWWMDFWGIWGHWFKGNIVFCKDSLSTQLGVTADLLGSFTTNHSSNNSW